MHQPKFAATFLVALLALLTMGPAHTARAADAHWLVTGAGAGDWFFSSEDDNITYLGEGGEGKAFRLPMRKEAFAAGDVTLKFDTDAKNVLVKCGASSFPLKVKGKDGQVIFRAKPAPAVLIDGKADNTIKGRWLSVLMREKSTTVSLEFRSASYVNIKATGSASSGVGAGKSNMDDKTPIPVMLETVKRGAFQIQMFDDKDGKLGTGSGSLIHEDGYILTNFHVIHGGSKCKVLHAASGELIDAKLWHATPDYDLALLKIDLGDFKNEDPGKSPMIVSIAQERPDAGNDCWAVGYPLGMGYTVTKGVVNGVRDFEKLPAGVQRSARYSKDSHWVQTDCTINAGNSGGPLVNRSGQIVGVNTWVYNVGSNLFFALSSEHIQPYFDKRPEEAMTFKKAREKFGKIDSVFTMLPRNVPEWEIKKKRLPSYVKKTLYAVQNHTVLTCSKCGGSGRTTGYSGRGPQQVCTRCRGQGRYVNPHLERIMNNVINGLAEMDKDHRDSSVVMQEAYDALLNQVGRNPKVLETLGRRVRGILAQKEVKGGITMVTRAAYWGELPHPDLEQDKTLTAVLVMPGNKFMLLHDMIMQDDAIIPGQPVLVGGIVAGKATSAFDRGFVVLQHGFMLDLHGQE